MLDTAIRDAIARLPCWPGRIDIAPLGGGMTNRNYRVSCAAGGSYVVRAGRDLPEHGIMRFNEVAAARAAHAAGIAPEVVYAGEGFLVSRYVDGRTLAPEDLRDAARLAPVVELLRRCHTELPRHFRGPALIFWVFHVIRDYLRQLAGRGASPFELALEQFAARADALERSVGAVQLVYGHNDLLAANFLDDGRRLWLIDWEYAGYNSALFDLANLSTNNGFSAALEARLLAEYYGAGPAGGLRRGFLAMQCASLLREALWGAVSQLNSTIEFDYAGYARDYYERFGARWRQYEAPHG